MTTIGISNPYAHADSAKVEALQNKVATLEAKLNALEKNDKPKADTLQHDKIGIGEVKRGFIPGVKGLFAGAATGGLAAGGSTYLVGALTTGMKGEQGLGVAYAVVYTGAMGILAGGITGAAVTQITGDKKQGALIGAGVGAVTGAVSLGLTGRNLTAVGIGALSGAVAGAASGYASSFITKTK